MCKNTYSTRIGTNLQFAMVLKSLFPEQYAAREQEVNEMTSIKNVVQKYTSSNRYKFLYAVVQSYISKTKVATFEELERACNETLEFYKSPVRTSLVEIQIICTGKNAKWNSSSWGIYSSEIVDKLWINNTLSMIARKRLIESGANSSENRPVDSQTRMYMPVEPMKLSPVEKDYIVEMLFAHIYSSSQFYYNGVYTDIIRHVSENISSIDSRYKTLEWIYSQVKDFGDIDPRVFDEYMAVKTSQVADSQIPQPSQTNQGIVYRPGEWIHIPGPSHGHAFGSLNIRTPDPITFDQTLVQTMNTLRGLGFNIDPTTMFGIDEDDEEN
jgi:hypothetical protein